MGFHIVNIENGVLKHDFVETYEELSFIEFISDDSIIYQGEEHWKPFKVSEAEKYKHFSKSWFRAGIQAQSLFKEQASDNGFILEELNQDQKSFKSYTSNSKNLSIKRGDFIIRNFANIEIDVKCRGFKKIGSEKYFDFNCNDAIKHQNMQTFTQTPILIAVYENRNSKPVDKNIYMISIDDILSNKSIEKYKREGIGYCYRIPLKLTMEGFGLIEFYYKKHLGVKEKSYRVDEKRTAYLNAYTKWSTKDDEKLELLYCNKKTIKELSEIFGRNRGAIRSRIQKLELKEKYDS